MGPTWIMSALLTTISTHPKCCVAWSTTEWTCSWFVTGDSQDLGAALRQVLPSVRQFLRITGGQDQSTSHPRTLAFQRQTESPCTPSNQDRVPQGCNFCTRT